MGFRTGAWAKVWTVEPKSPTWTKSRISISRKNKQTGQYDQDFSGYVDFTGTASAAKASGLHEGDTIKLGDVDVVRVWDREKSKEYINYKIYSFDIEGASPVGGVEENRTDGGEEVFMNIPDEETPW